MTRSAWTCRRCRALLGHVRRGNVHPLPAAKPVYLPRKGDLRVTCPECGERRRWSWDDDIDDQGEGENPAA